ncbi:MAG: methionine synthase, partial [Candidatus Omnitrophota bacterium]
DADTPIIMIPYDGKYKKVLTILEKQHKVQVYENLQFIEKLSNELYEIFGKKLFARPNQFRKQACWFGPFDEFLYLDTDIIVFEKIINNLKYLAKCDFICCDYQYLNGMKFLFTTKILEESVFSEKELKDVFNTGFWGSKKGVISEQDLYKLFEECARHPEYFDFSQKVSDMPIINYLVLKCIKRRFNIVRDAGEKGPGSWAGMPHFKREGNILIDSNVNKTLKYLHWAGIKVKPGCPYWDIWKYYRSLNIS